MMFLSRQYTVQTYQAQASLGSALEAAKKKWCLISDPFHKKTPQKHPESPSTTITNLNFAAVYLTSTWSFATLIHENQALSTTQHPTTHLQRQSHSNILHFVQHALSGSGDLW